MRWSVRIAPVAMVAALVFLASSNSAGADTSPSGLIGTVRYENVFSSDQPKANGGEYSKHYKTTATWIFDEDGSVEVRGNFSYDESELTVILSPNGPATCFQRTIGAGSGVGDVGTVTVSHVDSANYDIGITTFTGGSVTYTTFAGVKSRDSLNCPPSEAFSNTVSPFNFGPSLVNPPPQPLHGGLAFADVDVFFGSANRTLTQTNGATDSHDLFWTLRRTVCDSPLDSDGDAFSDCEEAEAGTDPGDSTEYPDSNGEDPDNDGFVGEEDECPNEYGTARGCPDADTDGVPDVDDNCPNASNTDQADQNRNGIGDACDPPPNAPSAAGSKYKDWGGGLFTVQRDRWGAVFSFTVQNTSGDDICVYANAKLVVSHGIDGFLEELGRVCGRHAEFRIEDRRIIPQRGTFFGQLLSPGHEITFFEMEFCRDRIVRPDDCAKARVGVPQHPAGASDAELGEAALIIALPLAEFDAMKDQEPGDWDWADEKTQDGSAVTACSIPGFLLHTDLGVEIGVRFDQACERHDFGYKNFGKRWMDPTDQRREYVDELFRLDLEEICEANPDPFVVVEAIDWLPDVPRWFLGPTMGNRVPCATAAHAVYDAVRDFGGPSFYGEAP